MSPVRATAKRTIGIVTRQFSTAWAVAGFFAASSALLSFALWRADGMMLSLSAVIASTIAPVLPIFAALVTMEVWSDERITGRIDVLLSTSVRERDLTLGKFFGAWTVTLGSVAIFFFSAIAALWHYSPSVVAGTSFFQLVLAFVGLGMQSALWCAITVMTSAFFQHSAAAAAVSVLITSILPRGLWMAVMEIFGELRTDFGEMPLDAQAIDIASGMISSGVVLTYIILILLALFISSKAVASLRFVGLGARALRASTKAVVVLATIVSALSVALVIRLDIGLDLPVAVKSTELSSRTHDILSDIEGEITITCFLPRRDVRFRSLAQQLRHFRRSAAESGARVNLQFVDPNWDLAAAERLISRGATEGSMVFERGNRLVTMPLNEGWSERMFASSIRRLSMYSRRQNAYWTIGHGEIAFDDYGNFGMSDIAREMVRDGYRNSSLDLAAGAAIPGDCALVVIAGARQDFSRAELDCLQSYLGIGGRLLVLTGEESPSGISSLLMQWGMRLNGAIKRPKSSTGAESVVSEFGNHAISSSLKGSRLILGNPVSFSPAVSAEVGSRVDRVAFTAVATLGEQCLVAAVERGAQVGNDLAIRPTRIVTIGDAGFVMNGELRRRANSNRDFFLNCVAYLAGMETTATDGNDAAMLMVGMDGKVRMKHLCVGSVAIPLVMFALLSMHIRRRRRVK